MLLISLISLSSVTLPPQLTSAPRILSTLNGTSSYTFKKFYNCILQQVNSSCMNAYQMFHPIAPNFLLSWTIAWKKANPNKSFLYSLGLLQSFSSLLFKIEYVLNKLDLRPDGGSKVILTEFWRVDTGNLSLGILVNQSLKSG